MGAETDIFGRGGGNSLPFGAGCLAAVLALVFPFLPVFAEVIEVDVASWAETGKGMTADGWEVSGIDRYADGLTRFDTKDDFSLSPDFQDVVTQVVARVRSSNNTMTRFLTLTPVLSEQGARQHVAVASTSQTNETFVWARSEGVRRFRLQNDTGNGNAGWGIAALTVYTDRIEPPAGLREEALYSDAFTIGWQNAPEAVRYQARYAFVCRVPPRFTPIASWDFSSLTNTYGSTRYLDQLQAANPGRLDDLGGEKICMQAYESGHIQIGTKDDLGCLVLPVALPAGGAGEVTGILRAWKQAQDPNNPTMPIFSVCAGVTSELATVELTVNRAEYRFPVPGDLAADFIILSSTTNGLGNKEPHGRVRIESFAIVSDYVPGTASTNGFESVGIYATERTLKNLASGEWIWSVRAFDASGRDSPWSPFRTVVLDPLGPRRARQGGFFQVR